MLLCVVCGFLLFLQKFNRFKEDQPIDEPPTEKYTVTPQNNPEQSLYACQGIRNKRPFTSKPSDNYKTKNLREYEWAMKVINFHPANILSHFHSLFLIFNLQFWRGGCFFPS